MGRSRSLKAGARTPTSTRSSPTSRQLRPPNRTSKRAPDLLSEREEGSVTLGEVGMVARERRAEAAEEEGKSEIRRQQVALPAHLPFVHPSLTHSR